MGWLGRTAVGVAAMGWLGRTAVGVAAAALLLPVLLSAPELAPDLAGHVVVITGGSRGIGRGMTMAFVEAGATVYITGRSEASLRETCALAEALQELDLQGSDGGGTGRCIPRVVDNANDTSLDLFFAAVRRETAGRLDVLVNNAYAGMRYFGRGGVLGEPFWAVPDPMDLYDAVFEVGVRSHYKATTLAIPMMMRSTAGGGRRRGGLVVNTNSPGCLIYGINVAYGMGKCAVDKMTADMAMELATEKIDIVSLYPGLVQTEEVLRGSVDVGIPRRGAPPGMGILPPFSTMHGTLLAETPLAVGRATAHFARDAHGRRSMSGLAVSVSYLARRYGLLDERGVRTPSVFLTVKGLLTLSIPALRQLATVDDAHATSTHRLQDGPCGGAAPLLDVYGGGASHRCGRGGSACPLGSTCDVHPADRWAVCCLDAVPGATVGLTAVQHFYFNVMPDMDIPIWACKLLVGTPLTMQWPL